MRRDELLPSSPSFFGTNSQQKNLNRKKNWRKKERKKEGKSKRERFVVSFWVEDEIAKVSFATYRPHKRTRTYFFAVKLLSHY
jgi:hypothetical protein